MPFGGLGSKGRESLGEFHPLILVYDCWKLFAFRVGGSVETSANGRSDSVAAVSHRKNDRTDPTGIRRIDPGIGSGHRCADFASRGPLRFGADSGLRIKSIARGGREAEPATGGIEWPGFGAPGLSAKIALGNHRAGRGNARIRSFGNSAGEFGAIAVGGIAGGRGRNAPEERHVRAIPALAAVAKSNSRTIRRSAHRPGAVEFPAGCGVLRQPLPVITESRLDLTLSHRTIIQLRVHPSCRLSFLGRF